MSSKILNKSMPENDKSLIISISEIIQGQKYPDTGNRTFTGI